MGCPDAGVGIPFFGDAKDRFYAFALFFFFFAVLGFFNGVPLFPYLALLVVLGAICVVLGYVWFHYDILPF